MSTHRSWIACVVAIGCGGPGQGSVDAGDEVDAGDDGSASDARADGGDAAIEPDAPVASVAPASISCHETDGDYFEDVAVASDGAVTAVGYTRVYFGGPVTTDALIVRMAPDGAVVWQKRLGGSGDDAFAKVVVLPGGAVLAVGNTTSHGGGKQAWTVRFSSAGTVTSESIYPGASWDEITSVLATADGGQLLIGYTGSFGAANYDGWLVKLDSAGDVQWQKRYGDSSSQQDRFSSAIALTDGYLVVGRTASFGTTYDDLWVLRLDMAGTVVWQYRYNVSTNDRVHAAVPTPSGVLLAGETFDRGWVTRLALDGTVAWSKLIDNTSADGDVVFAAQAATDGLVLAGYTFYTHPFGSPPSHDYDFWMLRMTSSGELLWSRALGGEGGEWARGLASHPAGGYVAVGWSESFAGVPLEPGSWMLAVSDTGSTTAACDTVLVHAQAIAISDATITRQTTPGVATTTTTAKTPVTSPLLPAAVICAPTSCAQ